ncbi:MAG: phosphopyruvate hydratase [Pseudomonadales bacterium]
MTTRTYLIERAEILPIYDSRARLTLAVTLTTAHCSATGIAPSGASTGRHEARELRDSDGGLASACRRFDDEIAPLLLGRDCREQRALDEALVHLDGTPDRSRLGGNTLIATSMALPQLAAAVEGVPLWQRLSETTPRHLPLPEIQIIGGGAHAHGRLPLQDFMITPLGAPDWPTALAWSADVYRAAGALLSERGLLRGVADEGGFWPEFDRCEDALDLLLAAIERAGRRPDSEVAISLDVAANQFHRDGRYHIDGDVLAGDAWVERLLSWTRRYPIRMVEDPCAETDPQHYAAFCAGFAPAGGPCGRLVVGDDLVVTSVARIEAALAAGQINAALIKPNQAGTLSEAKAALDSCPVPIVSARSGETEDTCIVDLAVAWQAPFIKVGSITRGERTAKWNRGLRIHQALQLPLAPFPL